ncbi:MAG: hypothetical protein JWQ40_1559, partial [Segetibacter sp.]|nr:hypothetical protein [Segetibacter sp.]
MIPATLLLLIFSCVALLYVLFAMQHIPLAIAGLRLVMIKKRHPAAVRKMRHVSLHVTCKPEATDFRLLLLALPACMLILESCGAKEEKKKVEKT